MMKMQQILLIDDDPIMNFINGKITASVFADSEIVVLVNGLDALEHIRTNPENQYLVFLDINMPVMNGWEFLEALSEDPFPYRLSIHLLTSSVDLADKSKAQGSRMVLSYIVKPLTRDVLADIAASAANGGLH